MKTNNQYHSEWKSGRGVKIQTQSCFSALHLCVHFWLIRPNCNGQGVDESVRERRGYSLLLSFHCVKHDTPFWPQNGFRVLVLGSYIITPLISCTDCGLCESCISKDLSWVKLNFKGEITISLVVVMNFGKSQNPKAGWLRAVAWDSLRLKM